MKTRFAKYGSSMHLRIPAEIVELVKLDLEKDYDVEFSIDGDSKAIIIKIKAI
jgi:antitoxin component of MazEF toxin-antitoxin module